MKHLRRRLVPLLVAGLSAALVGVSAPSAQAAVALPWAPDYGPAIDGTAYVAEPTTCTNPQLKPGLLRVMSLLELTYPEAATFQGPSCRSGSSSGHNDGKALDWMVNARIANQKAIADAFIGWLQAPDRYGNVNAMARRLGVMYIIWDSRMWRTYDPGRGWTEYSGCLTTKVSSSYDNACHRNHVHLSFTDDGALARTSYFSTSRLAGQQAFDTAIAIGRVASPSAQTVVIASADPDHLVDGVVAAPLARKLKAPILTTAQSYLPAAVATDLRRRKVTIAYVIGGRYSVSQTVTDQLQAMGIAVRRLAGAQAWDTAAEVARVVGSSDGGVFVASAETAHLVDALAAGGPAGSLGRPILVVPRDSVPASIRDVVADLKITSSTIVGGTTAMPPVAVEGFPSVERLGGATQYDTAVLLAQRFASTLGTSDVVVTAGERWHIVDALPGGALGSLVVLTAQDSLPSVTRTWLQGQAIDRATVLGGPNAVARSVVQSVQDAVRS